MKAAGKRKKLPAKERDGLLETLKSRYEEQAHRHKNGRIFG